MSKYEDPGGTISNGSSCRCPSCGYVHSHLANDAPVYPPDAVVVPEVAPVVADVPQAIRCPLCGAGFTDGEVYTAHRAANCAHVETETGSPDPPDPELLNRSALDLSNVPVAPIVDPADVVTIAPAAIPDEDPNAP